MDYAKVLVIDTNVELYDYSVKIWAKYGLKSNRVDNIEQALEELSVYKYHLIILVECKEQRQRVLDSVKLFRELTLAPIVITSTDPIDSEYRIAGFDLGADEVWEMPKVIEEVIAKGNAIIRRYTELGKAIVRPSTIVVNRHIILSTTQRLVYVRGDKVELTKIEFDLITLLITHPGNVFTYEQIFSNVWGDEFVGNAKEVLRNQIYKLRDKLKVDPILPNYIKTHQGLGYSFFPEYDNH